VLRDVALMLDIKICLGTACHVSGGDILLENFERKREIKAGETTPDRKFSIDKVACLGCWALAPAAVINDVVYGHMTPSEVRVLGYEIEKEQEKRERQPSGSR
jgi:NADH-quinone oxidoreductase subunit E